MVTYKYPGYNDIMKPDVIQLIFLIMLVMRIFPKKVYQKVGFFDESFIMFGEDLDYCYRIKKDYRKTWYRPDL